MTDTPGVPEQHQPGQPQPGRASDRTIPATCQDHGRCTLRVTRSAGGGIVLDPHAGFSCVLTVPEAGLRDALAGWLGREGRRRAGISGRWPIATPTAAS